MPSKFDSTSAGKVRQVGFPSMKRLLMALSMSIASIGVAADLPRSTPEAQGISSAGLLKLVNTLEQRIDHVHSIMIVRHGKVVAEGWWTPYAANKPHELYSLSKSFASSAIGMLIAEGKISLDDPVIKHFPQEAPATSSSNLKEMRIRDLLCMSTGQHGDEVDKVKFLNSGSIAKQFLALPVAHKPGTLFYYNTAATYMLSAIAQKVTGLTLTQYLTPRLFEPLGIKNPKWNQDEQGVDLGGFGLNITTEDIAKFGLLYLQRGEWNGQRLLPSAWVDLATSKQASNGSNPNSDWDQGYGYQFWRCRGGFYRGDGAFGQYCIVMPEQDTVVAITSGTNDMGTIMSILWDQFVPELRAGKLPASEPDHQALVQKLGSLVLPLAKGSAKPSTAVLGKKFGFETNALNYSDLTVSESSVKITIGGKPQEIPFNGTKWTDLGERAENVRSAVSGGWTAADTLVLKLAMYETPYVQTLTLKFVGDRVEVDSVFNVSFGGNPKTSFTGVSK